jgi:hypothetical protein
MRRILLTHRATSSTCSTLKHINWLLIRIFTDLDKVEPTYDSNNLVISLNHSNGNAICFTYNVNRWVTNARFIQAGQVVSEVFYTYNGDGLLSRVSDENSFILYDYTADGDLMNIRDNSPLMTAFTYDDFYQVNATSTYINEEPLQQGFVAAGMRWKTGNDP